MASPSYGMVNCSGRRYNFIVKDEVCTVSHHVIKWKRAWLFLPRSGFGAKQMLAIWYPNFQQLSRVALQELNLNALVDTFANTLVKKCLCKKFVFRFLQYSLNKSGDKLIVMPKVRHLQNVSALPLMPWIAAERGGTVLCVQSPADVKFVLISDIDFKRKTMMENEPATLSKGFKSTSDISLHHLKMKWRSLFFYISKSGKKLAILSTVIG